MAFSLSVFHARNLAYHLVVTELFIQNQYSLHFFVHCGITQLFWFRFSDIVPKLYRVNFTFDNSVFMKGYELKII